MNDPRDAGGWRRGLSPAAGGVGPPSPVRRSQSGDSGERVSKPVAGDSPRRQDPPPRG